MWLFLIAATVVSWALGTNRGVIVLVVAFLKVRFVNLYFMLLKHAPLPLRALIEVRCMVVCALTVGFFLAA